MGVVKLVPVLIEAPPERLLYQSATDPDDTEALRLTVPVPQRDPLVTVGAAGTGLIVAVTAVLVDDKHPVAVFLAST